MDDKKQELSEYLKKHGLSNPKWISLFNKENITHPDHILVLKGSDEKYKVFASHANEDELRTLQHLFEVDFDETPDTQTSGLQTKFTHVGLDSDYWLPIFSKQLGVTSTLALEYIGEESLSALERFVRHTWEKKALQRLLGIEEEESVPKTRHTKQREKLKQRIEKAKEVLQELKTLQSKGKDRHDTAVQQCESNIREMLQISPSTWIPKDTSLETVISQLQSLNDKISGTLQAREELSDALVVQSASGGLALQGIMLTKDINDQLKVRSNLLRPPAEIRLLGPSHPQEDKIEQFFMKSQEDTFLTTVDKLGYSITASAKGSFWGFCFEVSGGYSKTKEEERKSEEHTQELYSSTVKYCFMPLASYSFGDSDLHLSNEALKELKSIEMLILTQGTKNSSLQSECEKFFRRFGSHANRGPINFGGIYCWKCSSKGFKHSEMQTVKTLQRETITAHVDLSYGCFGASSDFDVSRLSGKLQGKYTETLIGQTLLKVNKKGGPPEASSLPEWKTGLVASNSTWRLVDRGTELVPVWLIIEMNHVGDFQKTTDLVNVLKKAWEVLASVNDMKPDTTMSHMLVDVLEAVKRWNDSPDASKLQDLLDFLLSIKWELIEKTLDPQIWSTLYLSQPPIQQFLKAVTVIEHRDSYTSSGYIKVLMQQLVERMDLNAMTLRTFPEKHYVSQWLYDTEQQSAVTMECQDFESFSQYIKIAINNLNTAKVKSDVTFGTSAVFIPRHVIIRVTACLAKAIYLLQCNLLKSGQRYESLFLATLVYPFKQKASDLTFNLLSLHDLECLHRQLSMKSKEFFSIKEDSKTGAQAYLFLMTIDTYGNESEVDISEPHVCQHLQYLKQEIGVEIDLEITDLLIKHQLPNGYDWEKLQQGLEPLAKGLLTVEKHSGRSLQDVMQEYEQHSSLPPKVDQKDSIPPGNSKAHSLFTMLDLFKYYPQRLSLQDALVIRQETLEAGQCSDPSQLYLFILHKVMTYDYKSRKVLLKDHEKQENDASKLANMLGSSEDSDSDEDSDDSDSDDDDHEMGLKRVPSVHPMDGLLALLHCADDFLRQDLMSRLVTCQLAIPFILPDPFTQRLIYPIRAMKGIVKEWKCTFNGKVEEIECPVVSYPTPIISFLRFGRHDKSKSYLLNEVISDSHHDHFFHRDCEGGSFKQLLGVGLVELCWYFPSGKPSDIFPDAVTFLNLHGDARQHSKQADFLGQISFMTFVLLTEEDLDERSTEVLQKLSATPGGFVLLLCASNAAKRFKQQRMAELKEATSDKVHSIKLAKKNADEIKKEVRRRINKRLQDKWLISKDQMTLGKCSKVASKHGFDTDEDNEQFVKGQALACNLQKVLSDFVHKNPKLSAKETMLPLQGASFWQKWAEKDKEEHRHLHRGIERIDVYISKKQEEKAVIRRRQFEHNLSPLMESFILSLLDPEGVRRHFLQCFKYYLDNLSRKNITELQHKYQENKLKLVQLQQNKEPNERAVKQCKKEIDELHQKIIEASFGLEHLLRELSQVYEAAALSTPDSLQRGTDIEHLPQVAAELLAEGYPLELMDGDAAHVPITWVTAVLKKAVKLLNDPQVFVLSVLGLQSTGKSTLMNSAFGLQFNVSAGRCTRGAFMQLLPVSDQLKKETNCDYVLVVDTEGLRAPELDSLKTQQHDNELATFVIGLANVTMINIKGETPGDMDDILQTAVHAFLRMKTVKLNPSCQFIHQNVGAVTASSKGGMGRTRFKQKLDEMTHAAAEEEKCGEQFESFSDVIQFDDERDVHYFPSLWKGDPPMAPVNDGYSEQAQGLKCHLVKVMKSTSNMYLSQFVVRLSDLWNALLHEKFVFSFKNTLEIRAYNTLDAEYGQWAWALQSKMLKWEQEAETEMENTKTDPEKFKKLYLKLVAEVPKFVEEEHGIIKKKMKEYFENSKQREMLAQWQRETELRLQSLVKELRDNAVSHCTEIMTSAQAFAKVDEVKVNYRTKLLEKVKNLVPSTEEGKRLSEDQLKMKFNEQWIEWMQDLKTNFSQDKEVDIIASVENSLKEVFRSEEQTVIMKLKQKSLKEWGKYARLHVKREFHVKPSKRWYHKLQKLVGAPPALGESHMKRAQDITDDGFAKVKDYLEGKKDEKFNPVFTTELLHILLEFLASEDTKSRSQDLHFEREYKIDLSLTACGYAVKQFEKMNEVFKKKNDPILYLEQEMKEPLLQYFTNKYLQIAKEKAAASQFCRLLSKPLEKQVIDSLPEMIVSDMKTHNTFLNSKPQLIATLLLDLGENLHKHGDFKAVTCYVSNPKYSLEQWIKQFTIKHCDGGKRIVRLAKQKLEHLIKLVSDTVEDVTTRKLQGSSQTWLTIFFENEGLKKKLKLDRTALEDLGGDINELEDIEGFRKELLDGITKVDTDVRSLLEKLDSNAIHLWTIKPYDLLFKRLHGCCALCPFCKEQCTDTNENHSSNHSVPVHRPQCVGGYRWADGSSEMVYKTCCTLVDEDGTCFQNSDTGWKWHPYKDYKQKYGKWSIPTTPRDPSAYWKWFVGNYSSELARHYGAMANRVDGNWQKIEWSEAQRALMKDFNL